MRWATARPDLTRVMLCRCKSALLTVVYYGSVRLSKDKLLVLLGAQRCCNLYYFLVLAAAEYAAGCRVFEIAERVSELGAARRDRGTRLMHMSLFIYFDGGKTRRGFHEL